MNKQNKFEHLTVWCEAYHEKSGLKVHPSSVPVDVVLDELLGQVMAMTRHINMITNTLELITEQFLKVNGKIKGLEDRCATYEEALIASVSKSNIVRAKKEVKK